MVSCCYCFKVHGRVGRDDDDLSRMDEEKKETKKKTKPKLKPSTMHYSLMDGVRSNRNSTRKQNKTTSLYNLPKREIFDEDSVTSPIESINMRLDEIEDRMNEVEQLSDIIDEWKCIALIVDRMCFIVIFGLTFMLTLVVFVNGHFRSIIIPEVVID